MHFIAHFTLTYLEPLMFPTLLLQTPHWVWWVLAALTVAGFKQTMPRRRSVRSAAALPVLMAALSLYGVASVFIRQPLALAAWAAGVVVVLSLVSRVGAWSGIRWSAEDRNLIVPGSWLPLALMLGLFCVKFSVGVTMALHPNFAGDANIAGFVGFIYGAFSGAFLARALAVWRVVRQAMPDSAAY